MNAYECIHNVRVIEVEVGQQFYPELLCCVSKRDEQPGHEEPHSNYYLIDCVEFCQSTSIVIMVY
jgi:hypothetical protein